MGLMGVAGNGCGNIPTATRLTLELNSQSTLLCCNTDAVLSVYTMNRVQSILFDGYIARLLNQFFL